MTMGGASKRYLAGAVYTVLLCVAGCNSSLKMEAVTEVPTPLVPKLPLHMGIYYNDAFRNYTYEEDSEERPNWSINSGASQVQLFDTILEPMFNKVRQVHDWPATADADLDAVLVPEVNEMQFALPKETGGDLFEVWIKYIIHLYGADGGLIAEWPVTGYGKSSTELLTTREKGLQAAINNAFRDAGAKFSIHFTRVGDVRNWLAGKPEVCSMPGNTICGGS